MADKITPPPFRPSQETPWAQLETCFMNIRGWTMNIKEGVSDPADAAEHVLASLDYIEQNFPAFFQDQPWDDKNQALLNKFLGRG